MSKATAANQTIERVNYPPDERGFPPVEKLPFVKQTGSSRSNWNMPEIQDYAEGNRIGLLYAVHFAQLLADNPGVAGSNILGHIAKDVDFEDEATKGCWVGFFAYLEILISSAASVGDIWGHLEHIEKMCQEKTAGAKRQKKLKAVGGES